jgi:predicted methyltransferase
MKTAKSLVSLRPAKSIVSLLVLLLCAALPWPAMAQAELSSILASSARPQEDRDRDASRHPAEFIEFLGIGPGDRVADLLTGGGYWTRILVPLVGPSGRVYAGNNPFFARFFGEAFDKVLAEPAFANVVRIDGPVDDLELPEDGSLDAAIMVMAYHDLFLTDEDRGALNRTVFAALKPGGVYGIIDHEAGAGAGSSKIQALHRIEKQVVIDEIEAAGFKLADEANFLSNPADDHSKSIFDPAIMGKTDRFVLRFEKPRD